MSLGTFTFFSFFPPIVQRYYCEAKEWYVSLYCTSTGEGQSNK